MWQRVSPVQRFSIDTTRSSSGSLTTSRSSSGNGPLLCGSDASSPLDSPRIAAVRQQQDLADSATGSTADTPSFRPSTSANGQQQQRQQQGSSAASNLGAPVKVLKPSFRPSRLTATAAPPTHISTKSSNNSNSTSSMFRHGGNLLLNVAVTAAFLGYSCHSWSAVCSVAIQLASLWVMWRAMELLMWGVSHPARTHLGMTLAPHFVNPFASTSLTDFWARRWNITQVGWPLLLSGRGGGISCCLSGVLRGGGGGCIAGGYLGGGNDGGHAGRWR
jgi:hypothetical protein